MTLFEYVSVAVSIVLSLAGVRCLSGLSVCLSHGRRSWVHATWLFVTLFMLALVWWNFWSFRTVRWNFFSFLMVLCVPGSLYLMAVPLAPEDARNVVSWEEHFFGVRRRFFWALVAFFVLIGTSGWMLLGLPLNHPIRGSQAVAVALALSGALSANRRLHQVLPVLFLLVAMTASVAFFAEPAPLVPRP